MTIKKTDLTKLIKEELTLFYVTPDAFAKEKKLEAAPKKKPLQERKFLVKITDIGSVLIDGQSESEVRMRLVRKLKGGKRDIESINKITRSKADIASKKLGIEDDAVDDEENIEEAKLTEANPVDVKRMFGKKMKATLKALNIIKQSLGYLDKRQAKDDSGSTKNLMMLVSIGRKITDVEQALNKFPQK
jgi:hypothetical protein